MIRNAAPHSRSPSDFDREREPLEVRNKADAPRLENELIARLRETVDGACDLNKSFPASGAGGTALIGKLLNALFRRLAGAVTRYASNTVSLSKMAPELAQASTDLAKNAKIQARHASEIAVSVSELSEASHSLSSIVELIERTAVQIKILSINAAIEASRAGAQGLAFGVVAAEIQKLSEQTTDATSQVASAVREIHLQIEKTTQAVGVSAHAGSAQKGHNHHSSLAALAAAQAEQAEALRKLAETSRETCDRLVTDIGIFRIAAHERAKRLIEEIANNSALSAFNRRQQENLLRDFIRTHPAFELLYVTDTRGRQVISNIGSEHFQAAYGTDGYQSDWSSRPWFQGALKGEETYVSDIYRSAASEQFCFTISRTICDSAGHPLGVIGADVRLEEILRTRG